MSDSIPSEEHLSLDEIKVWLRARHSYLSAVGAKETYEGDAHAHIERLQQDNARFISSHDVLKLLIDTQRDKIHELEAKLELRDKQLSARLQEIDELRMAERHNVDTVATVQQERDRLEIQKENLLSAVNSKQAKIDALMLEFYPGEMSAEQRAEWATNQRLSEPPSSPLHHCNICGGEVDLSNATRPTEKVGRGPKFKQTDAPDDGAMRGVAVTKEGSATCSQDSSP